MWQQGLALFLLAIPVLCGASDGVDEGWYEAHSRDPEDTQVAIQAFKTAMEAFKAGDVHSAYKNFLTVTEYAPEVADGWSNAGVALEKMDKRWSAFRTYTQGVRAHKRNAPKLLMYACNLLLQLYEHENDRRAREKSLEVCQEAVKHTPGDVQAVLNLATAHAQRMNYDEAISLYTQAITLRPDDYQAVQNMANVLLRAGEGERALSTLRELQATGYNNSGLTRLIGTVIATTQEATGEAIGYMTTGMAQYAAEMAAELAVGRKAPTVCDAIEVVYNPLDFAERHPGKVSVTCVSDGANKVSFDTPPSVAPGSNPPPTIPLIYTDKRTHIVTYTEPYLVGESGVVFMAKDCVVFTGDHLYNARVPDELRTEHFAQGAPTVDHAVEAASVLQAKLSNYYHWMCEGVARLLVLMEHVLSRSHSIALLIPDGHLASTTLSLLDPNLPNKVITWKPSRSARARFNRLHTVYFEAREVSDDSWATFYPPATALGVTRDTLRALHLPPPPEERLVYVSRRDAGARVVEDEEDLLDHLLGVVGSLAVFVGSGLPLKDQLSVFRSAEVVVAPHGAGIANLIVAPKGCSLILLPMRPYADNVWGYMSAALGFDLWLVPDLNSFYYTNYNTTRTGARQLLRTLHMVLSNRAKENKLSPLLVEALRRPQWRGWLE